MELQILHTNDIHSAFDNLPKLNNIINKVRIDHSLLLDAGDFHDFKSNILTGTNGKAGTIFLKALGYDALTIGNNEGFCTKEQFRSIIDNQQIPFVCCNLRNIDNSYIHKLSPSIIKNINNKRFLIIGSSVDGDESYNRFFEFTDLKAINAIEAIKSEIYAHKDQFDICIVLSHLGFDKDCELANAIEDIDIIIGGHWHKPIFEETKVNNAYIFNSGYKGEYLGDYHFDIDDNNHVTLISQILHETKDYNDDNEIIKLIKQQKKLAIKELSKPVYNISHHLYHDLLNENPLTNACADMIYKMHPEADLAIINAGLFNGGIEVGPLSMKKLLDICPSPLNPTIFKVQGVQIYAALNESLDAEICLANRPGPGFRGYYLGCLCVSNNVRIEHTNDEITKVKINNEDLDFNKYYTIVSSDYIQRGSGYPSLVSDDNYIYDKKFFRDYLLEYLNNNKHLIEANTKRFKLIKEDCLSNQ